MAQMDDYHEYFDHEEQYEMENRDSENPTDS